MQKWYLPVLQSLLLPALLKTIDHATGPQLQVAATVHTLVPPNAFMLEMVYDTILCVIRLVFRYAGGDPVRDLDLIEGITAVDVTSVLCRFHLLDCEVILTVRIASSVPV